MGCTKVQESHSFLFTNAVITDCLLSDNMIPFHYSVKVSDEKDFVITWKIFKNTIESDVKGDLKFNPGCNKHLLWWNTG